MVDVSVNSVRQANWANSSTLCGEELFLAGPLVVDAVECKGELLGRVLWAWYFDQSWCPPFLGAVDCDNNILVQLTLKKRTYSRNHSDRHCGTLTSLSGHGKKREKLVSELAANGE